MKGSQYFRTSRLTPSSKHVKNQLERRPDQFTSLWKWRVAELGESNNGLSEGENGPREMSRVEMATSECKCLNGIEPADLNA